MSLVPYIHAMGRGPSRARSLTQAEAEDAMRQMLDGSAEPAAIGALLMLMRYRGETAEEVAGFTLAARAALDPWQSVDAALDWPSYAAGRSRGLPWFLLSARLIAEAGYPVLLHGWNSHQNAVADVRAAVETLSLPRTETPQAAQTALKAHGIAYVPLEAMSPKLLDLLKMRDVLGLRSAVNTVCRMLNPSQAATGVQGVFHPPYRALQRDAAQLLGQKNLTILKGAGGEFERNPAKDIQLIALRDGTELVEPAPQRVEEHRRLADAETSRQHLLDVWLGNAHDAWGQEIVVATAAAALWSLQPGSTLTETEAQASALWRDRSGKRAA